MLKRLLQTCVLVVILTVGGAFVLFRSDLQTLGQSLYATYQGHAAFQEKRYEAASRYYQLALKGFPNPAYLYTHLGDTEMALQHTDQALSWYQHALESNPNASQTITRIAGLKRSQGHPREALTILMSRLQDAPNNPVLKAGIADLYLNIARDTQNRDDFDQAALHYRDYFAQNPNDDAARYKLAESLYAAGRFDDTLDLYCDLATRYPNHAETLYSLALAFAKNDAYHEAYITMSQAAELASGKAPAQAQQWARHALTFKQNAPVYTQAPRGAVATCLQKLAAAKKETASSEE